MALLTLTVAQVAVITGALADAERYRRECGSGLCADCAASPDGACQDHLEDLDRANAYSDVAGELVMSSPNRPAVMFAHHGRPGPTPA